MKISGQDGSAALEFALVLTFVCLLISGGLTASYLAFARVWLSRSAYEGVICLATKAAVHDCKRKLKRQTALVLPIGKVNELRLKRSAREARVDLSFQLSENLKIKVSDRRSLPLR